MGPILRGRLSAVAKIKSVAKNSKSVISQSNCLIKLVGIYLNYFHSQTFPLVISHCHPSANQKILFLTICRSGGLPLKIENNLNIYVRQIEMAELILYISYP